MKQSIPASITLIQSIATQLNTHTAYLKEGSKEHQSLKLVLKESTCFDTDIRVLNTPSFIAYLQCSLLLGLSMFEGIFVPAIKQFKDTEGQVDIIWDNGTKDSFQWGVYDDKFKAFTKYYQDRLSSKPQHKKDLPTVIMKGIAGFIHAYLGTLAAVELRINALMGSKQSFVGLFDEQMNRDLLFIIISSFPADLMSAFYVHIQSFFPEELEVTTPDGRQMKVVSLFQNPTVDINYLIEKTKIYCDLYFNPKMPIIRQITQSKSKDFIQKAIQNDDVFQTIQTHLKSIKTSQIDPRVSLYKTFKTHLDTLL